MFRLVLFDLDGTLTNPYEGITNSIKYALNKLGEPPLSESVLKEFIGPPLYDSFAEKCGFDKERSSLAVDYYREYFSESGLFENSLYPDTVITLERLRACGVRLAVATSKPETYAKRILEHFGIDKYFENLFGPALDKSGCEKPAIIKRALCGETDLASVLMCGDRKYDVLGAKENGIKAAGVLHGYGSYEELSLSGADFIVPNLTALVDLIIK